MSHSFWTIRNLSFSILRFLSSLCLGVFLLAGQSQDPSPRRGGVDREPTAPRKPAHGAPSSADASLNRGLKLAAKGRWLEAEQTVREALQTQPDDPAALTVLGKILARTGRVEEALTTLQRVVEVQPRSADAHLNLGILMADSGDLAGANAEFQRAVNLDPASSAAHYNKGRALLDLGRTEQARSELERAIELDSRYTAAQYSLAVLEKDASNLEKSSKLLYRLLQIDANNTKARYLLGVILEQLSNVKEAVRQWEKVLETDPNHRLALFRLSQSLRLTDPEKASYYNQRFFALRRQQNLADRAGTIGDTALVLAKAGNYPEAISKLREAIGICGDCSARGLLHKNLGLIYARAGEYESAAVELKVAGKLLPNDPEIRDVLDQFREAGIAVEPQRP